MSNGPGASSGAVLVGLAREARAAANPEALRFLLVNRLRGLVPYRQAILVEQAGGRRWRLVAISALATVDAQAPFAVWVAAQLKARDRDAGLTKPLDWTAADTPPGPTLGQDWSQYWPARVHWLPGRQEADAPRRGLILVPDGDDGLSEAERMLAAELLDIVLHALVALERRGGLAGMTGRGGAGARGRRWLGWGAAALALGLLAVPVRLSAVAPAEVAPRDPVIVAAPIPGVVAEIVVEPNAEVAAGDVLVRFETAELNARLAVAERALAVAEADLLRARQQAFGDPRSSAEVALKQAAAELRRAEREFAAWLVGASTIRAERAGLAVFASASEWTGRPVAVGERIMAIADPAAVRVDIRVPVADAVVLRSGAPVSLILDVDPLNPVRAVVERAAFQPEAGPGGVLAYRVTAAVAPDQPVPRIGLTGTARIAGESVPLGLFLFRRPIAAARQWLGI